VGNAPYQLNCYHVYDHAGEEEFYSAQTGMHRKSEGRGFSTYLNCKRSYFTVKMKASVVFRDKNIPNLAEVTANDK